jgi:transcriptional regulator
MYIPKHFAVTDKEEIYGFIAANSFGQLISTVNGRLFATLMPFLLSSDRTTLYGHLARQNPQHGELENQEILVSLQGPHDYISPSWYSSPGVPTWNYQSVHLYGHGKVFTAPDRLKKLVDALTLKHESPFPEPWQPTYKATMLQAIVGVEITISEIQCKYKLSQNRSDQDRAQVESRLTEIGSTSLADAMVRTRR